MIATRSEGMVPAIARGWGSEVSASGRVLELCVTAPVGSPTRANLTERSAIAIAFSPPTIATAIQVKGVVTRVAAPDAQALARAEKHLAGFTAEAAKVAPRADQSRRMFEPSQFLSVTVSVEEVFDQTPGPGAGRQL